MFKLVSCKYSPILLKRSLTPFYRRIPHFNSIKNIKTENYSIFKDCSKTNLANVAQIYTRNSNFVNHIGTSWRNVGINRSFCTIHPSLPIYNSGFGLACGKSQGTFFAHKGTLNLQLRAYHQQKTGLLSRIKGFRKGRTLKRLNNRIQKFRLYISTKRQKFKGIANKSNRRKKLNELKQRFLDRSIAFKLKALLTLKRYGKIGAGIYLGVYVVTLALMTSMTFSGYLSSNDVRKVLERLNISASKVPDMDSPFAKFTVAYILTKVVEPIRLIISIILTISVTKLLKK